MGIFRVFPSSLSFGMKFVNYSWPFQFWSSLKRNQTKYLTLCCFFVQYSISAFFFNFKDDGCVLLCLDSNIFFPLCKCNDLYAFLVYRTWLKGFQQITTLHPNLAQTSCNRLCQQMYLLTVNALSTWLCFTMLDHYFCFQNFLKSKQKVYLSSWLSVLFSV